MADDDKLPLMVTEKEAVRLKAWLTFVLKGSGGIECKPSPDGATWAITLRRGRDGIGDDGGDPGLIPVSLSTDGGADGSSTTKPTYTYQNPVNLITGKEIFKKDKSHAAGLSPQVGRQIGEFDQAEFGMVYMDDGDPILFRAYEVEKVCTDGGVSGTFTTVDGKTITITDGIVTSIV